MLEDGGIGGGAAVVCLDERVECAAGLTRLRAEAYLDIVAIELDGLVGVYHGQAIGLELDVGLWQRVSGVACMAGGGRPGTWARLV